MSYLSFMSEQEPSHIWMGRPWRLHCLPACSQRVYTRYNFLMQHWCAWGLSGSLLLIRHSISRLRVLQHRPLWFADLYLSPLSLFSLILPIKENGGKGLINNVPPRPSPCLFFSTWTFMPYSFIYAVYIYFFLFLYWAKFLIRPLCSSINPNGALPSLSLSKCQYLRGPQAGNREVVKQKAGGSPLGQKSLWGTNNRGRERQREEWSK